MLHGATPKPGVPHISQIGKECAVKADWLAAAEHSSTTLSKR